MRISDWSSDVCSSDLKSIGSPLPFSAAPSCAGMNGAMRANSALILSAVILMATPAAAQQSPRDFTLPPPPVEPAQGPVDDSGVVPVAPRMIPAERPAKEPASDGATAAAPGTAPSYTQSEGRRVGTEGGRRGRCGWGPV